MPQGAVRGVMYLCVVELPCSAHNGQAVLQAVIPHRHTPYARISSQSPSKQEQVGREEPRLAVVTEGWGVLTEPGGGRWSCARMRVLKTPTGIPTDQQAQTSGSATKSGSES